MSNDIDDLMSPLLAQIRMAAERVYVMHTAPTEPIPPRSRHFDQEAAAFVKIILAAITPAIVEQALNAAKDATLKDAPRSRQ